MAKDKNSFVLYTDLIHTVEHLSNEQAGQLFKTVLQYVNDQNPEPEDIILKIAFEPIKRTLKRDLKKYEKYVEKQRENGKKGGRPKKPKETQKTQAFFSKPKKADSVSDSDSDSGSSSINTPTPDKNVIPLPGPEHLEAIQAEYNTQWAESFRMQAKVANHPEAWRRICLLFDQHLKAEEKTHTSESEYKKHFRSWTRQQATMGNLDGLVHNQKRRGGI